jgi:hypothetical protein
VVGVPTTLAPPPGINTGTFVGAGVGAAVVIVNRKKNMEMQNDTLTYNIDTIC